MEGILNWGLDVIRVIQTIEHPALTVVISALTQLGSEYFYFLALPIVLWCIDERFGLRLGLVVLASAFLNGWLKLVFRQPRPYDLDASLGLAKESTYGLPSGHSQGTATFWGMLAPKFHRPWGLILALGVPLVIGYTRLYLGVHFPTDLFLGWGLGWGIALAWFFFGNTAERVLARIPLRFTITLAAFVSLGMNMLMPEDTNLSGVFFGTAAGAAVMFSKVGFRAGPGSLGQKALRLLAGIAGLSLIYFGGKLVSPEKGHELYALARFIRYGLVGLWASLGAPWLFVKLGLAEAEKPDAPTKVTDAL